MARRKVSPSSLASSMAENRERLDALADVAKGFGDWRPRREVIRPIDAVPTILPDYDRVVGIGGHPIGRITLTHGPTNHGKTEFALALGLSYLQAGHFFALADAERTTTEQWVRKLMAGMSDHPGFVALPVRTYEHCRDNVRKLCDTTAEARDKGRLPADVTGLIVIDSLRKLVPEKLWKTLAKNIADGGNDGGGKRPKKARGVDGFGGRAGQMKAALNAAWVDELVPLLSDTNMSLLFVGRETVEESDSFFGDDVVRVGGGAAVIYDSSLRLRVQREFIHDDAKRLVGERHTIDVHKTKVANKDAAIPRALFHVKPGEGFDPAATLVEVGLGIGLLEQAGAHVRWRGKSIGQGFARASQRLRDDTALFAEVDAAFRAKR